MIQLRDYQRRAIDACHEAHAEGVVRPLVVHPTGTGKTVTFSHASKERAHLGRSLILVHREELASQTANQMAMIAPELQTGVVQAERNEMTAPVVIASVWTLVNRMAALKATEAMFGEFATVIVDEAHHAPALTWRKILTAMHSFSPLGPLTMGFTATPERDGKSLDIWERVVDYMSIREAVLKGYLVRPTGITVETSLDLTKIRKTGGDYREGDLGGQMTASGAIEEIADAVVKHAADRKGVAFLPTVATAHALADALRSRGITAEALDGTTPKTERKDILARLKTGATQYVCNCGVLTEGFDEPSINCVVMARPTKFHGLYVQCVGRGTRKHPGKTDLLVLDITGASQRHELITIVDLGLDDDGPKRKRKGEDSEPQVCAVCDVACDDPDHRCSLCQRRLPASVIKDGLRRHRSCTVAKGGTVDVLETSRLRWLPVEDGFCLSAGREVVVMAPTGNDAWKLATYEDGRLKVLHEAIPSDWAMGIGEDHAKAFQNLNERKARWLTGEVSEAQKSRLIRENFPADKLHKIPNKGAAADLITRIQGRRAMRRLTTSA